MRDSRAACASTQGKWGRSWGGLEGPGALHWDAARMGWERYARAEGLLSSLRAFGVDFPTFIAQRVRWEMVRWRHLGERAEVKRRTPCGWGETRGALFAA